MYKWTTKIRYVKGLGPTKARTLTKLGIETVGDLLCWKPLHYLYPGGVPIAEAKEGMVVIKARVTEIGLHPYSGRGVVQATLMDDTGNCQVTWYNSPWLLSNLHAGMTATFYGKYKAGVLQQPKWTTYEKGMENVYGGQYGVHHDTIRAALKEVLANVELPDVAGGGSRVQLFTMFHFPRHKHELDSAINILKFDEALQLQLALAERRREQNQVTVEPIRWTSDIADAIADRFPYLFTRDQLEAKKDVVADLACCVPMQRLIHGEVGSGKTAVAFYAAMLAALNGKRALILCPTTILAQQHYDTLLSMGWNDVALHPTARDRRGCCPLTYWTPFTNIVIGTHAMLYNEELLKSASLVIIDEFSKFGVEQRAKIQQNNPHLLLLSATPIPRTLAATVFGDLDVSVIKQLPIQRGTVITKQVLPEKREAMYEIIEKELAAGHQAYVVYPRISGGEDVVSAESGWKKLNDRFAWDEVRMLTGKATPEYKVDLLQRFKAGTIKILVSTIIAEVGLDNPNATVMVVEGADRFGLSQLHQLRGRICRSTDTAFCFLVSETSNPTSIARLEVIEKCNDGFILAEHDLRLRGSGDVFSTRQHGLPDFKFVDLIDDFDLMVEARDLVASGDVGDGVREMMKMRYDLEFGGVV